MKFKTIFRDFKRKIFSVYKADVIISVGAACRVAHYLQRHNLRCGSFPLDWMMNYTLKDASRLFHNEFRNFFEHIKQIDSKNGKRIIQDMDNGMISMHDFPTDISVQEYYHTFKETMQRRARRMLNALKDSKNINPDTNHDFWIGNVKFWDEIVNAISLRK